MTIAAINASKPGVLDLLSAKPQAVQSREPVQRAEAATSENRRGFIEHLRERSAGEASSARPTEPAETKKNVVSTDTDPGEPTPTQSAAHSQGASEDAPAGDSTNEQETAEPKAVDQPVDDEAPKDDLKYEELPSQNVLIEVANALQTPAQHESAANSAVSKAAAEVEAQALGKAQHQHAQPTTQAQVEPNPQGKANAGESQQASPVVNLLEQSLQQGAQADADGGDRSDQAASTPQAASANTTNANATAANSGFALPDQASSEARIQLNTNPGVQHSAAAQHVATAQPTGDGTDSDSLNSARLTRGLANAVQQRGGAVTIRLTPPEMGTVRIQMQITGTGVSASFHAESASAHTLLTSQLAQLRSALENQGMNVEKLSVQPLPPATASQNTNHSQNQNQNDNAHSGRQHEGANEGRSRGQYSGDGGRSSSNHDDSERSARRGSTVRSFFDRFRDAAEPAA